MANITAIRPLSKYVSLVGKPSYNGTVSKVTYDVSWEIKTTVVSTTSWKLSLLLEKDISWKVFTLLDNNISWKVLTLVDNDISWKLINGFTNDISWKVFTLLENDTSWKLSLLLEKDISWKVFTLLENDTSWKSLLLLEKDISWKVLTLLENNVSWQVTSSSFLLENEVSWKIPQIYTKFTAWKTYTKITNDVFWEVLSTILTFDTSWGILNWISKDTSWRIQPSSIIETSYAINNVKYFNVEWGILNSPLITVSWKIIEDENNIPGVNTHNLGASIGATQLNVASISINSDLDSFVWSANITLGDQASYDLCVVDSEIIVTIDAMTWHLKIIEPSYKKEWVNNEWTISAISCISSVLDELVYLKLETPTYVSEVAQEIMGTTPISWNTYNWVLPDDLVVADNVTRKEAIQALVKTINGYLFSTIAGELEVHDGEWANQPVLANWDDASIYSLSTNIDTKVKYNRVIVGSTDLAKPRTVTIETISQDQLQREIIIGIYITPNSIPPEIQSCSTSVSIHFNRIVSEANIELVQIVDGVFSISSPFYSFTTIDYLTCADLGTVTQISDNSFLTQISGNGIAKITYETVYYEYRINAIGIDEVSTLFCASVPSLRSDIIVDCHRGTADSLSPEILLSKFCTDVEVAKKRGKIYLDSHTGGITEYDLELVWDGSPIPKIGCPVKVEGIIGQLVSTSISATYKTVSYHVKVEV